MPHLYQTPAIQQRINVIVNVNVQQHQIVDTLYLLLFLIAWQHNLHDLLPPDFAVWLFLPATAKRLLI